MTMPGWTDQQLASLYYILDRKMKDLGEGTTEGGCLAEAMKQVELADVCVEKRQRDAG
jgi:hypothetical protein